MPKSKTLIEASIAALNVFIYLRVSTGRQLDTELSVPDQRWQIEGWCEARSHRVAGEFIDGTLATDDKRPEFQRMIDRSCDGENAVDLIAVHSYSRFFRDSFDLEFYLRKLDKHGVKLVSITQDFNDDSDPAQGMMRKIIGLFDEYQSKENAKYVIRSIKENVR